MNPSLPKNASLLEIQSHLQHLCSTVYSRVSLSPYLCARDLHAMTCRMKRWFSPKVHAYALSQWRIIFFFHRGQYNAFWFADHISKTAHEQQLQITRIYERNYFLFKTVRVDFKPMTTLLDLSDCECDALLPVYISNQDADLVQTPVFYYDHRTAKVELEIVQATTSPRFSP